MPVNNINVRPSLEEIGNIGQRAGKKDVITVQVGHDIALGALKAEVDRISLTFVRLAAPTYLVAVGSQDVDRTIDRSAILDMIK